MMQMIKRPAWLVSTALFAAMVMLPPAAAQEVDGECVFGSGDIKADQVTGCLGGLERRIEPLEPGGARAADIDGKLEDLLARVISLESTIDDLKSTVEGLSAHQPEINFGTALRFDWNEPVESDGLIIAFFTVKSGSVGTGAIQATLQAFVDEEIGEPGANPETLRVSDSFLANNNSKDRSATIVMPVKAGEWYRIVLTIDERPDPSSQFVPIEFNDSVHVRNIYFVSF